MVDDAERVGGGKRLGHLQGDGAEVIECERASSDTTTQRLACHVLHRDEEMTVGLLADFVHRAHMRVGNGGRQACLTKKARSRGAIVGNRIVEQLQGNPAHPT